MAGIIGWLPGGLYDAAGLRHREVELTELTGRDELRLNEAVTPTVSHLTTLVLSRAVRRVGTITPVHWNDGSAMNLARSLLVADRHYLLVKLRELIFGDRIQLTLHCPLPTCQTKIDIDFRTSDIPIKEGAPNGPLYPIELSSAAAQTSGLGRDEDTAQRRHLLFRLPTGADQEVLAPMVETSEAQAARSLLYRCIQQIGTDATPPTHTTIDQLSPLAQSEIEAAMEVAAPQVTLTMEGTCPVCGQAFDLPFDLPSYFLQELRRSADQLQREIHYLAYHYHWSERSILAMPKAKRRTYLRVLADEIERMSYVR